LKNPSRGEVATVATISGKLENPKTSTWEAIFGLIQNAFFKSILPGFEKATEHPNNTPEHPGNDETARKARGMTTTAQKQPAQ